MKFMMKIKVFEGITGKMRHKILFISSQCNWNHISVTLTINEYFMLNMYNLC